MRQCLFCDQKANSKEHIWASWILERVKPIGPIRHSIGKGPTKLLDNPELTTKHVCAVCNGGWMSNLESANIPIIGSLLQDISIPLDPSQQQTAARWAVKTAMVVESVKADDSFFYSDAERDAVRSGSCLPRRTTVWLGRYAKGSSVGAFGTDIWIDMPDAPKAGNGCATTIVVGHLAVQVLSLRFHPQYGEGDIPVAPKTGPWEKLLVPIWPVAGSVTWPPPSTFGNAGSESIATLMERWKIGMKG
jgi:hypothetical protein